MKRRAVGFSEVSLSGVTRSAKPITTAYTLVSASTYISWIENQIASESRH